jgi:nucleoside-diphosphate-sugar epimerase
MITVLGAQGFIGSHLLRRLREMGIEYRAPARDESLDGGPLGDVIYCIGLTSDFRSRPFDTVRAHVSTLADVLETAEFDSLLYLSSSRVYAGTNALACEDASVTFCPSESSDLYNISKLMGEALCLSSTQTTRIARLSNVYGVEKEMQSFLASVITTALRDGVVHIQTAAASSKDFVAVDDVVGLLIDIATRGQKRVYNVASGENVPNRLITDALATITHCAVEYRSHAPLLAFPPIDVQRVQTEFGFRPTRLLNALPDLVEGYRDLVRVEQE